MGIITPCMTFSESGQPTGGGPCAAMAALDKENIVMRRQMERLIDERDALLARVTAGEEALRDLRATTNKSLAAILVDNGRLRAALLKAVKMYGQPGGPWNVPSEPGTWLAMAKESLGLVGVDGTAGGAGEENI